MALEAVTYTYSRQHADWACFYGADPRYLWIDSFQTDYNLDSLKRYIDCTGDREFERHFRLGADYFKTHFFEPDGRHKSYYDKADPIEIQCAAQAIDTLTLFSALRSRLPGSGGKRRTITNMRARDGHFYYGDLGWMKVKTPMLHWGQAPCSRHWRISTARRR